MNKKSFVKASISESIIRMLNLQLFAINLYSSVFFHGYAKSGKPLSYLAFDDKSGEMWKNEKKHWR